jgi:alpha,alpha-trehalose phosphorylase
VAYALCQYVAATGDTDFLDREAVDILVETARMWADLGFWRASGDDSFHIHGVTGPDEYTTVVNDNLFTNVMARSNLRRAVQTVRDMRQRSPAAHARMVKRLGLHPSEVLEWARVADAMAIPFDEHLGIHPQDRDFLAREVWDLPHTPPDKLPLLLHYHPWSSIGSRCSSRPTWCSRCSCRATSSPRSTSGRTSTTTTRSRPATRRCRDACSRSSPPRWATRTSRCATSSPALFVDLADLHSNSSDGVHVASTGGCWSAAVFGFGGLRDYDGRLRLDPRLPRSWEGLTFRICLQGSRLRVHVGPGLVKLVVEDGPPVDIDVRGETVTVSGDKPVEIEMDTFGPLLHGSPTSPALARRRREDGSVITAALPSG